MTLDETLQEHTTLCSRIYELMIEENRHLSTAGTPTDDALLERKRTLLAALTPSLDRLRAMSGETTGRETRTIIERAMQTILKALLLDRENEQLLLKTTIRRRGSGIQPVPAASHLQRIYGQPTVP
jgi:flagellar biosynthesis/type III secretory pathway chaperone